MSRITKTVETNQAPPLTAERILELGAGVYSHPRQLADGTWICVGQFIFTWGLVVGITETSYQHRYCFHTKADALHALGALQSMDDEPTGFIVKK